jgi:hypothetical protein
MADKNKAFAYLEEAFADRSSWLIWLKDAIAAGLANDYYYKGFGRQEC